MWTEHGCIGFRSLYTTDPEYSDLELISVGPLEASGESRDELCPSTPLNSTPADTAETLSQAD